MFEVALITPYYLPHIGGVEIHVANIAARINSVVISSSSKADFQVKSIPVPYSPIPLSFPEVNARVYHSHVPSPFFAAKACNLAEKFGSPHVVTYHNDVVIPERVNGYKIPSFVARFIEKFNEKYVLPVLEKADAVIATTRSYAETSNVLKRVQEKLEIIPNAVDTEVFKPCNSERRDEVIYVGRLVEYKGLGFLIKAVKASKSSVGLTVVGDGEDRKVFEEMCRKLGVRANFTGRVSRKELVERIGRARLLVLPSFSRLEAFGIVLLEAMACSTPVAGANVPGVGEIASKAGFTFSSVEELACIIDEVAENDALVRKLGRRGRKVVEENYCWDVVIEKITKLYEVVT